MNIKTSFLEKRSLREMIYLAGLILIPTLLLLKVIHFDFVNWDDDLYVYENVTIRSFAWDHWVAWWTRLYASLYVPIPMISYAADYLVHGSRAGGYHVTNLVIHGINILLTYALFKKFFRSPFWAFAGALLFGIHPAQIDSVAWISQRKNLICGTFFLGAMNLFVGASMQKKLSLKAIAVVILLFSGAILSKITAVVAPLILIAYDYFYGSSSRSRKILFYIPLLILSLVVGLYTLNAYHAVLPSYAFRHLPKLFAEQIAYFVSYFKFAVYPLKMNFFYAYAPKAQIFASPFEWPLFLGLTAMAVAGLFAAIVLRKKIGFWIAWFLLFILPVAVFPVPASPHHLYFVLIGFIGLLVRLCIYLERTGVLLWLVLTLFCVPLAHARLSIWQNSENLWKSLLPADQLDKNAYAALGWQNRHHDYFRKNIQKAFINLAVHYQATGQPEKAVNCYEILISICPSFREAYLNLINLYLAAFEPAEIEKAKSTVAIYREKNPGQTELYTSLAGIARQSGDQESQIRYLKEALQYDEDKVGPNLNLGLLYFKERNFLEAIPYLKEGIKRGNHLPEPRYDLGIAYIATHQWQRALDTFKKMLEDRMEVRGIYFQMGYVYLKLNQRKQAWDMYQKSTQKNPEVAEAYHHLGLMCIQEKDLHQAKLYFEKALKVNPSSAMYRERLAKTLAEIQGKRRA